MNWAVILQLIITIITTILEWLGGGIQPNQHVLTAGLEPMYHLVDRQWQCDRPHWTEIPNVTDGRFHGTVALDCMVEGINGGGIFSLRSHLANDMVNTAARVDGEMVETVDGLPTISHDVDLDIDHNGMMSHVRGKSSLATNGYTELRHIFKATQIPTDGDLKYLKGLTDQVQVTTTERDGWYHIHMTYSPDVAKPWFVSKELFKSTLMEKCEERMEKRKERVVNDLASHL